MFFSLVVVKLFIVFFFLSAFLGFLACSLVLLPLLLLLLLLLLLELAICQLAVCLFFSRRLFISIIIMMMDCWFLVICVDVVTSILPCFGARFRSSESESSSVSISPSLFLLFC